MGYLESYPSDTVELTTSEHGSFTIFGLEGPQRQAAADIAATLKKHGHTMHFLASEKMGRPEDQPSSVQCYGVWPHPQEVAIAALRDQLSGVTIEDRRDPDFMRGVVPAPAPASLQPGNGEIAPAGSIGRAA